MFSPCVLLVSALFELRISTPGSSFEKPCFSCYGKNIDRQLVMSENDAGQGVSVWLFTTKHGLCYLFVWALLITGTNDSWKGSCSGGKCSLQNSPSINHIWMWEAEWETNHMVCTIFCQLLLIYPGKAGFFVFITTVDISEIISVCTSYY